MLFWAPKAAFPPKVLGTFIFGTYLVVPGSKKKKKRFRSGSLVQQSPTPNGSWTPGKYFHLEWSFYFYFLGLELKSEKSPHAADTLYP